MIGLRQDLHYAARTLRRSPGFTSIAVLVLAAGIGANSAIFSLVDTVLLRPLPFHDPQELAMLWEHPPGYEHNRVAPLNFADWSEQNQVFSSMAAISGGSRVYTPENGAAEKIAGQAVTLSFFDLLGIPPVAGRTFAPSDAHPGNRIAVISERIWRSHFGADPKLVGRTIPLDGQPFTVIGIAPATFQILYPSDLWTLFIPERGPEQRRMHYLQVIGRLKPGVDLRQARAGMDLVAGNIARVSPETNKDWTVTIEPLHQATVGQDLRTTSLVLAAVVGFVLLMACANVASLLLARGAARSREMAVRASLGGSMRRIVRQLLIESTLLSLLGGSAGLALAALLLRAAPLILPPGTLPVEVTLHPDARVAMFSLAAALVTGILFGLAPAVQSARTPVAEALRSGGRTSTGGGSFRAVLAAGEVAVAVLLVAGAGLLVRTLGAMTSTDPGFRTEGLLTMSVGFPFRGHTPEEALSFYESAVREIQTVAGVQAVALATNLPADGWDIGQGFEVVGRPAADPAHQPAAHYQMVSANYFDTMGISLLRGRTFTDHDGATSVPVCIVNEEFVAQYLKGLEPVGTRLRVQAMNVKGPVAVEREIVGVSRQVKVEGLSERKRAVEIYVPVRQNSWYSTAVAVRIAGNPLKYESAIKEAVARAKKDQPVTRVRTMDEVVSQSIAQPRFRAGLMTSFAGLALLLAAAGIFGVLALAVNQRRREFGIRMALGARPANVLALVLKQGLKVAAAGVAVGMFAAFALTRYMATLLYGVKPLDPVTFLIAPAILTFVAIAACAAPGFRAARLDPSISLRQE